MTTPRSGTDDFQRLQRFRVYFLCECGAGWTRPLGSGLNHVHIGRHGGYAVAPDRQEAFLRENGPMILALLLYLWHGNDDSAAASRSSTQRRRSDSGIPEVANSSTPVLLKDSGQQARKSPNLVSALHEIQAIDLPKAIQQDVQLRFRTMIDLLVGLNPDLYHPFQESPSGESASTDNGISVPPASSTSPASATTDGTPPPSPPSSPSSSPAAKASAMWSYPASLSDMRRLYGYLGLHNPQVRQEQEPNGDLVRVTNLQGDATWICASHYRWTFYNSEVDSFFHWVESRGGAIDKQTGAVVMNIVSSDQLVRLCDWIIAKSGAALIELHLKLQWRFTRKDLWKLGRAVAKTNINVLTLNGCMYHEDSGFKILNKRHDPLLRMLEESRLQCLELSYFPSLFRRLSNVRFHAPMVERLVFGPGTASMAEGSSGSSKSDLASLASLLASCPNLRELVVPGLIQTETQASHLVDGLVTRPLCQNLSMLDLSRSAMNDGVAYRLAVGLDVTQIQHLNVSNNPLLSDRACARLIDGMRWRLASLGMAQTGFGDRALSTLISYLEGSDNSTSHGGLSNHANNTGSNHGRNSNSKEEGTHPPCPLVSLDIANNQCSQQAFQALARVRRRQSRHSNNTNSTSYNSHLRARGLVSLDLSLSSHLTDAECSQIVEKFVSPEVVKLRLAFCSVGDLTAKALAGVLLLLPCHTPCRLEELELQGNSMTSLGVGSLARALREVMAWSNLQSLDLSHSAEMDDVVAHSLLRGLIEADSLADLTDGTGTTASRIRPSFPLVVVTNPQQQQSLASCGFFSVLTELNLSSTRVGDETARSLARALAQSWVALETLTLLEPEAMTELGMATILEALTINTTVVELGIGSRFGGSLHQGASGNNGQGSNGANHNHVVGTVSSPTTAAAAAVAAAAPIPAEVALAATTAAAVDPMNQVDLFGTALLRLLEMNKRIRALTTIGAPMQAIAKGLLLNRTLVSLYLIKTRGSFDDLQAMGEAVAYNRSLLVLWMGGSDESLLRPMIPTDLRDSASGVGVVGAGGQSGGGGSGGHPTGRFGRVWKGDSLQDVDGLQNTTTRSGHWQDGPSSRRRNRRGGSQGSILFSSILPKSFRNMKDDEMTFHHANNNNNNHYNTVRKNPYMWSAAPAGGMSSTVIRNPLFDGIRRNHRLIKIRLDPIPTPLTSSPTMSREVNSASAGTSSPFSIPMQRKTTTRSVTFSRNNTTTTRSTPHAFAGVSGGGGGGLATTPISRSTSPPPQATSVHSPRPPTPTRLQSSISHQSLSALFDQVQQQERVIQQQLAKKMAANRAALWDHGQIGAEELRMLRVDEDIIREVCSDGLT
ncbi:hypothetical protein DFQ26_004681 [Actinomortierella ambigua]|nr:hypothetical protein DFQ26_004681 [Actinomortierella ambigua]